MTPDPFFPPYPFFPPMRKNPPVWAVIVVAIIGCPTCSLVAAQFGTMVGVSSAHFWPPNIFAGPWPWVIMGAMAGIVSGAVGVALRRIAWLICGAGLLIVSAISFSCNFLIAVSTAGC
jgi:hypothetical protein